MFKSYQDDIDPDPHQRVSYSAPKPKSEDSDGSPLSRQYLHAAEKPYLKRLTATSDIETFLQKHTEARMALPEDQRDFMKPLKFALLENLLEKDMHIVGLFVGDDMVSGCAILDPADKDIAEYLTGYDFDGKEHNTAIISAVWTDPGHTRKGYSKKVVGAGMELAVIEGKDLFRAKVDRKNAASLAVFDWLDFDTKAGGQDPLKVYPVLAL